MGNNPCCTQMLYKVERGERLFMIFDRDKPYEAAFYYRRLNPHTSGGSGFGIGFGLVHHTSIQTTKYTKTRYFRFRTQSDIDELERKLKEGFCFKCGNKENCTKLKYIK